MSQLCKACCTCDQLEQSLYYYPPRRWITIIGFFVVGYIILVSSLLLVYETIATPYGFTSLWTISNDPEYQNIRHILPIEYRTCYQFDTSQSHVFTPRNCQLPHNITVKISRKLAKGKIATAWLTAVSFYKHHSTEYAMKYVQGSFCVGLKYEYLFLRSIEKAAKITNINVPKLHPTIPFYEFHITPEARRSCLLFEEYVPNSVQLRVFPQQFKNHWNISTAMGGEAVRFIMSCYDDLMNVIRTIYDETHRFHNDMHNKQIMVNTENHKCYLIDFQYVFKLSQIYTRTTKFKCKWHICSAAALSTLYNNRTRMAFRDEYLSNGHTEGESIQRLAEIGMFDMEYKVIAMLVHGMMPYLISDANQTEYVQLMDLNRHIMTDGFNNRTWCKRLELLSHLNLNVLDVDELMKQRFTKALSVFEEDKQYFNKFNLTLCNP
eukprot:590661_1